MRERIGELARLVCRSSMLPEDSVVRFRSMDALNTLFNEARELAARECDQRATVEGIAQECAAAIRKLKVE